MIMLTKKNHKTLVSFRFSDYFCKVKVYIYWNTFKENHLRTFQMEEVLNDRIFKSKVDYWIPLIISLAFIPTIVFSIIEQMYLVLVISTLFYSFCMISIFNIKYIICGNYLLIENKPIQSKRYNLCHLIQIQHTHDCISSPAASLDRIKLIFSKGEYIIISPQNQKEFIRQIQEINPNIRIMT